jgi:hypothetical protein
MNFFSDLGETIMLTLKPTGLVPSLECQNERQNVPLPFILQRSVGPNLRQQAAPYKDKSSLSGPVMIGGNFNKARVIFLGGNHA